MKLSSEAKKKISTIARIYQDGIVRQAPSPEIGSGTTVYPVFKDNSVSLEVVLDSKVFYGVFLDTGTGKYYKPNIVRGEWNPNPGEGDDGIIPRYWMTLAQATAQRINTMLSDIILEDLQKQAIEQFDI
jgi:hypothetical protein